MQLNDVQLTDVPEYQHYRQAAQAARRGLWLKETWTASGGRGCLLGLVGQAFGQDPKALPAHVKEELAREINARSSQRWYIPKGGLRWSLEPVQATTNALAGWNDSSFVGSEDVVAVLDGIANRLEAEWSRTERIRLKNRIRALEIEVERLKTRLAAAEAEKRSLWRRLKGMQADQQQLASIEAELAETWRRLQAEAPEKVSASV